MGLFQFAWDSDVLASGHMALAHARCAVLWPEPEGSSPGEPSFPHPERRPSLSAAGSPHKPALAERSRGGPFRSSSAAGGLSGLGYGAKKPALPPFLAVDNLCVSTLRPPARYRRLFCDCWVVHRWT